MTNPPGEGRPPQDPQAQPGYWQQDPPPPYPPAWGAQQSPYGYPPDHPKATLSLVLGILGLVACGVVAPFAWAIGKNTVSEIDASNGAAGGRGSAQAGYILGIVGTVLLGLGVVAILVYFAFLALLVASGSAGY